MEDKDILIENLEDLIREKRFYDVLIKSLKTIKPSKFRIIIILIIAGILFFPIKNLVIENETIQNVLEFIDTSTDIFLAIFGITFTGYALFQALIGTNALEVMLKRKIGNYSTLKTYNLYFFILSISYIVIITCNFILKIIFKSGINVIINDYLGLSQYNILIVTFILIYLCINVYFILETKSFILNIYYCFNMSVFSEGIEIIKNKPVEENEKNSKETS